MILKQIPEDFVVEEIPLITEFKDKGKYVLCELKKRNKNTEGAVFEVSKNLRIPRNNISYAGTKDKVAVTTQYISILNNFNVVSKINEFHHDDISIKFLGFVDEPLSLGRLIGNKFIIVIRALSGDEKIVSKRIINFFHNQRFSDNNVLIGKLLLKKNYKEVVSILGDDVSWSKNINDHLEKSRNDFVGALKTIPKKILTLFIHSYQSFLWNKTVVELLKHESLNYVLPKEVPIIGFSGFSGFECDDLTKNIINGLFVEEGVVFSDFLNRDISYLTIEGTTRKTVTRPKDLLIGSFLVDDLNVGKKKVVISFELGKGEYATNVIEQLFNN